MQKIRIKHFKAIQSMELELSNILILIGEQASGKSTISKLIYFFKSLPEDLITLIYNDLESKEIQSQFWIKIKEKFYNYFGSTRHLHKDFEVDFYYEDDKFISLSLFPDKGLQITINPSDFFHNVFYSNEIERFIQNVNQFSGQTTTYERSAFQRATSDLEKFIKTLFNEYRTPSFIPAGRNFTVNFSDLFDLNLFRDPRSISQQSNGSITQWVDVNLMIGFLDHTAQIKQRFKSNDFQGLIEEKQLLGQKVDSNTLNIIQSKIEKILRGQYRQDQHSEKIFFADGDYIHLNNSSSGQQEVIRILQDIFLILLDKETAFRVIEEPEAHLYPLAQKHLVELLSVVLNKTDSQIIITTHSPYILSIFNNLLFATRVAKTSTNNAKKIQDVISDIFWMDGSKTDVYFLKDGYCESIFDDTTGLIGQNYLDEISEDLGLDFQELYQIYAESIS